MMAALGSSGTVRHPGMLEIAHRMTLMMLAAIPPAIAFDEVMTCPFASPPLCAVSLASTREGARSNMCGPIHRRSALLRQFANENGVARNVTLAVIARSRYDARRERRVTGATVLEPAASGVTGRSACCIRYVAAPWYRWYDSRGIS